jgi:hypothetical protein
MRDNNLFEMDKDHREFYIDLRDKLLKLAGLKLPELIERDGVLIIKERA